MKYIKLFEASRLFEPETQYKYKVGDYVLLADDENDSWRVYYEVKILDICSNKDREGEDKLEDYYVEAVHRRTQDIKRFWIDEYEIERKMTKKEIKEWEFKQDAKKYNL